MPTWGAILQEIKRYHEEKGEAPFDPVRRGYLKNLYECTGRNTILYASNWTQPADLSPRLISLTDEDVQAFTAVLPGLKGDELDIIVHSPGGSAEAVEVLVIYLRSTFNHIRVIIPYGAMSAATMLACSANEIVMGTHSFIGPTDPQMIVPRRFGSQAVPAQAILEQFERAQKECRQDPKNLGSWAPILDQYGPALVVQCEHALQLSRQLVGEWLAQYMFANEPEEKGKTRAEHIAGKLADFNYFRSHSRHISREQAREFGLRIHDLESDECFEDLVMSVFHATTHTFSATAAAKIVENHLGHAFVKLVAQVAVQPAAPSPGSPQ